jgi:hypothetical protein
MTEPMKNTQGVENVDYVVIVDHKNTPHEILTLDEWDTYISEMESLRDRCAKRLLEPDQYSEEKLQEAEEIADAIEHKVIPQLEAKSELLNDILVKLERKEIRRLKGQALLNRERVDGK